MKEESGLVCICSASSNSAVEHYPGGALPFYMHTVDIDFVRIECHTIAVTPSANSPKLDQSTRLHRRDYRASILLYIVDLLKEKRDEKAAVYCTV